jgi:hypothetical protein
MSSKDQAATAIDSLREVLRGDDASSSGTTFMRGLTLGALLGAAIAGSALWQRRARAKHAPSPDEEADEATVSADEG